MYYPRVLSRPKTTRLVFTLFSFFRLSLMIIRSYKVDTSEAANRARGALTAIISTIEHLRQTVHPDMNLTFHSRPASLADPAPEPKEGAFVSFALWLEEQRRYVTHLESTDDLELASLRMAVLEKLDLEINKLEMRKARAWRKLVIETMIGVRPGAGDDGPLYVKSGVLHCVHWFFLHSCAVRMQIFLSVVRISGRCSLSCSPRSSWPPFCIR